MQVEGYGGTLLRENIADTKCIEHFTFSCAMITTASEDMYTSCP